MAEREAAASKDWRQTVGMFAGNEFIEQLDAEVAAMREAERKAAREDTPDEPTIIEGPREGG